jgi:hypothetical protein
MIIGSGFREVAHPEHFDQLPAGTDTEDRCPVCGKALRKYGDFYWCQVNWECGRWFVEEGKENGDV